MKVAERWTPLCLVAICVLAFACRVFSVLRYESVIHEFDPYFNYRTTLYLKDNGFYNFWNWFDESAWYPLGRVVGQTLFPGLMITASCVSTVLDYIGLKIDIREVCVFTAPLFAIGTAIATYKITKLTSGGDRAAGLLAALIVSVCPSYLSRTSAGGFDNEAIAIFTLVSSFYTFLRAYRKGTIRACVLAAIFYFYMVIVWGGYVFVTNTIGLYCIFVLVMGQMDDKLFQVYTGWYTLGTMWCFNIPFVGLAAVKSAEHLLSHIAFVVLVAWYVEKTHLVKYRQAFLKNLGLISVVAGLLGFCGLVYFGLTKFSGRSMTLLDPSYATRFVPIIASISEHQPTIWATFHTDLGPAMILAPAGIVLSMKSPDKLFWFAAIFVILAAHFSAVMIRMTLIMAPAMAAISGIGGAAILRNAARVFQRARIEAATPHEPARTEAAAPHDPPTASSSKKRRQNNGVKRGPSTEASSGICAVNKAQSCWLRKGIAFGLVAFICCVVYRVVTYGTYMAAAIYSSPSIVNVAHLTNNRILVIDDMREAYHWLSQNTHPESKIMAWWDYGYQAAYMANRSVIVDNNTWNTTHIATVGLALSSPEEVAYPIMLQLDVDYVFVVFGGIIRYQSDDLNKFVWIIRISSAEFDSCPKEADFLNYAGGFDVGEGAAPALADSLMYKLSYHQYSQSAMSGGVDNLRKKTIKQDIKLKHLTEVYSTANLMVRIYQVNRPRERLPYGENVLVSPLPH